jgi:hypothetical protein
MINHRKFFDLLSLRRPTDTGRVDRQPQLETEWGESYEVGYRWQPAANIGFDLRPPPVDPVSGPKS